VFYLDTSILIAVLTPEVSSDRIGNWLIQADAGTLHISGWTLTEVSSALALKVRMNSLSLDQRAEALARFVQLVGQSLTLVEVAETHFETAARFCDNAALNLRAGDALHLAIAAAHGMTLATLDRSMAEAGPHLGIATQIP
jgi:predicted nucleic acid-binding protein